MSEGRRRCASQLKKRVNSPFPGPVSLRTPCTVIPTHVSRAILLDAQVHPGPMVISSGPILAAAHRNNILPSILWYSEYPHSLVGTVEECDIKL